MSRARGPGHAQLQPVHASKQVGLVAHARAGGALSIPVTSWLHTQWVQQSHRVRSPWLCIRKSGAAGGTGSCTRCHTLLVRNASSSFQPFVEVGGSSPLALLTDPPVCQLEMSRLKAALNVSEVFITVQSGGCNFKSPTTFPSIFVKSREEYAEKITSAGAALP